jgi:putative endonuclease
MRAKDRLGRDGEEAAAAHLTAAGCTVLARNWRCRDGELDLVVRDGDQVVFVEVKSRSGLAFGRPVEAVTLDKARRIRRLAAQWLAEHRPAGWWGDVRFDVVSVLSPGTDETAIEHLRGAF